MSNVGGDLVDWTVYTQSTIVDTPTVKVDSVHKGGLSPVTPACIFDAQRPAIKAQLQAGQSLQTIVGDAPPVPQWHVEREQAAQRDLEADGADGAQWAAFLAAKNAERVAHGKHLWAAQAAKFKPACWERIAVVGEELGTQRAADAEMARALLNAGRFAQGLPPLPGPWTQQSYLPGCTPSVPAPPAPGLNGIDGRISFLEAELAQLRRYNADLVEMARARGVDAEEARHYNAGLMQQLRDTRAEVEQLRRDNELLVQLANDAAAAHVAELAKVMASAAQTVVAPVPAAPPTKPEIPARALRFSA